MLTGDDLLRDIATAAPGPGACALWWMGQQSYIVKLGETVLYLDPYLSPSPRRRTPPLLHPGEISNAHLVFGTHDHGDHIDRSAWPGIAAASPRAVFVLPALLRERIARDLKLPLDRLAGVDDGRTLRLGEWSITGIAAAHELLDPDPSTGQYPCLGYVIEGAGFTFYHAGDTCIYEGLLTRLRRWRLDAIFLPINGRDARRLAANCIGNMTYQEAADLAGALAPRFTFPGHYDMFASNSEDPQLFLDYMRVKYPRLAVQLPPHGERVILPAKKT